MRLKKASLVKDTLTVSYTERKEDGTIKTVTEQHETKAHPDLLQAYQNLTPHFGLLCGFINIKQIKNIATPPVELMEPLHVNGISIKTGDDEGVTITGYFINPLTGKAVNTNTPFQRYTDSEENPYKFNEDLISKVERASEEIAAYLDGSKKAADPQQALPFDEAKPPQTRLPEDLESEDVTTAEQIQQRLNDKEIWQDGKRPVTA